MLSFTKQERLVLAFLGSVLLIGSAVQYCAKRFAAVRQALAFIDEPALAVRVDINTASQQELESLPHIGPVTAGRLIQYRESSGGFHSARDLLAVPGIGPRTYQQIAPHIKKLSEADVP